MHAPPTLPTPAASVPKALRSDGQEARNRLLDAALALGLAILAATDAPLRFKEWVPRVLQPLFRI